MAENFRTMVNVTNVHWQIHDTTMPWAATSVECSDQHSGEWVDGATAVTISASVVRLVMLLGSRGQCWTSICFSVSAGVSSQHRPAPELFKLKMH